MRTILTLAFLLLTCSLQGQFGETIRSGRPGQAIGPFTVGKHVLQVQSGVNFSWLDTNISSNKVKGLDPGTVIRFGIAELFEISGVINYTRFKQDFQGEEIILSGISNAQIGARLNLLDGQGVGPNIGIQSRLRLNVLSGDFNQENIGSTTILAISQGLGQKFGLTTNVGITWIGNNSDPIGTYVLNLGMDITDKVSIFIENYGNLASQDFDTRFDTGAALIVNPNLKLDFSAGYGNNESIRDYFFDIGFSWRTLTKAR